MTTLHPIHYKIYLLTRYWVRKGSKKHRQKQVRRMHVLAGFALTRGTRHIGQIGPRTLRAFQKATGYSDSTMEAYRQALQKLFDLAGLDARDFGKVRDTQSNKRRKNTPAIQHLPGGLIKQGSRED